MAKTFYAMRARRNMLLTMMLNCNPEDVSEFIADYIKFKTDDAKSGAEGATVELAPFYNELEERVMVFGNYWRAAFWRDKINEYRATARMSEVPRPPIGEPCHPTDKTA